MAAYSYADGNDFLERYDARRLADLVADDGIRVTTGISANANLLTSLYDATAEINSAVLIGKRYTTDDLRTKLTDTGYYLLKRLTCDLAYGYLVARRGLAASDTNVLGPRIQIALQQLEMLKSGTKIFDKLTDDIPEAGLATTVNALNANTSLVNNSLTYFGYGPLTLAANPYFN